MSSQTENPSVTRFREYLRLPSVHPNPDYSGCIQWLKTQASEIGLKYNYIEFPKPNEFTVWLTWEGKDPTLKSIILNSHIDVVPVEPSKWTHDPFGAEKDSDGNIYARGAQDMKCVGVQYLEAIRKLKSKGIQTLRTVHVSFVPDEEVGGYKGMNCFVKTPEFEKLNVGFAMDEGIASPDVSYNLYYGERAIWQFRVTATGKTGHASIMFDDTAAEKIHHVMNRLLGVRAEQKAIWKNGTTGVDLGDVTSVNMTMLDGGLQPNVVPPELSAVFDIRITPKWKLSDVEKLIGDVCTEAGSGVTWKFIQHSNVTATTDLKEDNVWWTTFKECAEKMNIIINPRIFPAATDAAFLREIGIPAFGFSPMNNTPVLLHDHDEYLNENVFLRGVEIYENVLEKIISVPKSLHEEWIKTQAFEIGLKFNYIEFPKPDEFTIWLSGTSKKEEQRKWTHDPFGAEKDSIGNIYARGAQDMKCVGVQYLEAIRLLKSKGFHPLRTVHITFVPDEEVGGFKGMRYFVKTPEFEKLNVGFAMDEGIASPKESFSLYYGERAIWQFRITATGKTGHSSIMFDDTASEKTHHVINRILAFRTEQKEIWKNGSTGVDLGDVTSVNMTMLDGGGEDNIVPPELSATFDMRITPKGSLFLAGMDGLIENICEEAGPGVTCQFIQHSNITAITCLNDDNVWWKTFQNCTDSMNLTIIPKILPGATDIRYLREIDIPAFGFSPMNQTPILLHDHDEFLNENVFLRGIEIYENILEQITNVPGAIAGQN